MECILCNAILDENSEVVSVTKGIGAIVSASLQRGDDKHDKLKNVSSITVHTECRKNYTRSSSIVAAKKLQALSGSLSPLCSSTAVGECLHSSVRSFDFKSHCLFCGEDVEINDTPFEDHDDTFSSP